MSEKSTLLRFEGAIAMPVGFAFEDFLGMPAELQVEDVSRFQPARRGDAVTLDALLERVNPEPGVTHVTLHADRDDFHVSIPINAIRGQGLIIYKVGEARLSVEEGGPIRLLVRDPLACHAGELDECVNVKYLSRIELSCGRGRDTRPVDDEAHRALHEKGRPG